MKAGRFNEIFTGRADWLVHAVRAGMDDVIRIYPRDGLTVRMIAEALSAQKILLNTGGKLAWSIRDHGECMFLQRLLPHAGG